MLILQFSEMAAFEHILSDRGAGIGEVYGWVAVGKQAR